MLGFLLISLGWDGGIDGFGSGLRDLDFGTDSASKLLLSSKSLVT